MLKAAACRKEDFSDLFQGSDQPFRLRRIEKRLRSPEAHNLFFMVARKKGRIRGYCLFSRAPRLQESFRIRGLHVKTGDRNCGLATRLLVIGCRLLEEFKGARQINSFIVASNRASLKAHRRSGFRVNTLETGTPSPRRHIRLTRFHKDHFVQ
ncbi:MAG: GNAT family N-acetyltransferase [Thermodesulfobacteriota bacterium]